MSQASRAGNSTRGMSIGLFSRRCTREGTESAHRRIGTMSRGHGLEQHVGLGTTDLTHDDVLRSLT